MAEIPIERKATRNWLPLALLGLLVLLALAWCFLRPHAATTVGADSTRATTATADTAQPAAAAAVPATTAASGSDSSAVAQYAQFVQARDTSKETESQHAYTAEGVRRLAAALDQVAVNGGGTAAGKAGGTAAISVYADSMRSSMNRLQRSSPQDVHANDAKAAFSAAVSAMGVIAKAEGRTYDVAPMRAIYGQLVSSKPLMPQLMIVERFFTAAGTALQALNIPGANAASGGAGAAGTNGAGTSGTGTGAGGSGQ